VKGHSLTMKYKGGERDPGRDGPRTAVVSYAPGEQAEVKAGTKIFVAAEKKPDGHPADGAHHLRQGRTHGRRCEQPHPLLSC